MKNKVRLAVIGALLLAPVVIAVSARGGPTPTAATTSVTEAIPDAALRLPTVRVSQLPPEGRATLDVIARGGPFPYKQDGSVFSNRERLLPPQSSGYYREYTVKTPGESDRGARRIVTGKTTDERYYTADHYSSFKRIIDG